MQKSDLKFSFRFRVRYSEIDAQGIVFNAHYLTYFDTSITEFLRSVGLDFGGQDVATLEYDYHLVKSVVEYHAPIYFDEFINVFVGVARIGNSSLTFHLFVYGDDDKQPRTSGEIIWVYANRKTGKSVTVPDDIREILAPYMLPSDS